MASPAPATYWTPTGPVPTYVLGVGRRPNTLVIGSKSGSDRREVPSNSVKFKFGPDSEKFGIPYKDPLTGINRNDDLRVEGMSLKSIAKLLREADKEEEEPGEDSLDDQIDKFLTDYEAEAKRSKSEGMNFYDMTRRFLLEAGEDEDEEKDDEKKDDDEEAKPEKLSTDDIDMGSFVSDVMRLVENFDSLLEVHNTILRRAKNYILKNYEPEAGIAFDDHLSEGYGMEIGKSKYDAESEIQAPKAGAAGPAGGGGA